MVGGDTVAAGASGYGTRQGGRVMKSAWAIAVAVAVAVAAVAAIAAVTWSPAAGRVPLCGQAPAAAPAIRHIIIVMLENRTRGQVIGSPDAPYETRLASACGNATEAFGATHGSASNYLAASSGQYPASSLHGCNYPACASDENNVYQQLDRTGRTWKAYEESMPSACDKVSAWPYKIGHNPAIFYTGISAAECRADDVPVASLTARSGAFYDALRGGTLPSVAWVTPDRNNDGEGRCSRSCALAAADTWLRRFLTLVTAAPAYRDGSVLVLVTYDEGTGPDNEFGENCADKSADLAGSQPSCHLPLFVVWQDAKPGGNGTFFTLYSITRTVEGIFGLPCLAHACGPASASLAGSGFGF
jgi:phosphatidylinositol-3-phosphatase